MYKQRKFEDCNITDVAPVHASGQIFMRMFSFVGKKSSFASRRLCAYIGFVLVLRVRVRARMCLLQRDCVRVSIHIAHFHMAILFVYTLHFCIR